MLNRPFNAVMARLAIVAAALALLMLVAPVVFAGSHAEIDYEENRTDPVANLTATDEDGDDIDWMLTGDDSGKFKISDDGVLEFKEKPDYESPGDANKNNVYLVSVTASETSNTLELEITVIDVDEDGKVSLTQPQPQVGRDLTASLTDVDAPVQDEKWQWARGETADGPWTDIDKATSASRRPVADDEGMYLRATVTYEDKFGTGKTASAVTEESVEERTRANAAPSFAHLDETPAGTDDDTVATGVQNLSIVSRDVDEGLKNANIGKPVMARDADNDVLLYTLDDDDITRDAVAADGTVTVGTGDDAGIDPTTLFSINSRSGQLTTKVDSLNSDDDGVPGTSVRYTIKVTATDPSGAPGEATVNVTINDVNDAPKFPDTALKALWVTEKATNLRTDDTDPGDTSENLAATVYVATDADALDAGAGDTAAPTDTPAVVALNYALEGPDASKFSITDSDADSTAVTLAFDDHTPNYEKQDEYEITIVASDDSAPEGTGKVAVTITVQNDEDDGVVTPTQREPQIGKEVVASLSDEDGNVRSQKWQWFRDVTATTDLAALVTAGTNCADATAGDACYIDGATSPNYTPVAADNGRRLAARVTYNDAYVTPVDPTATPIVDTGDAAQVVMQADVETEDPANTAPKFRDDQDANTPGDQADAERSVPENANNTNVGDPVTASDSNSDLLIYSLSGADAGAFKIDSGLKSGDTAGQIKTAMKLDYETKDSYMVVVTATDPSGATDTINVNISVTDEDDKTVVTIVNMMDGEIDYDENGTDPVVTLNATDEDGDDIDWTLTGDDAADFNISDDGVLEFKNKPNYESPADKNKNNVYLVSVTASETSNTLNLEITVIDVDEDGKVSLTKPQPQVGRDLTASLTDVDAPVQDEKWQWARGETADGPWTDIDKATSASRRPVADDEGMYLRATVTYEDKFGTGKTASAVTEESVEERTRANAAPSFAHLDETPAGTDDDTVATGVQNLSIVSRDVDEGLKNANIGKPVMARDADNDVLLYTISAAGTMNDGVGGTAADITNVRDLFSINSRSGQLTTKVDSLDSDDSGDTGDTADADGEVTYTFTVTATDPSGAPGMATVTVTINDVNDAPKFDDDAPKTLWVTEKLLVLRTGEAADATVLGTDAYVATDDDAGDAGAAADATATTPAVVPLKYSVEGPDAGKFTATRSAADTVAAVTLAFKDHTPNYEKQDEYEITIVASDDSAPEGVGKVAVTINVVNAEDDGTVTPTQREPQIGKEVVASLSDEDGNIRGQSWQWYRNASNTTGSETSESDLAGATTACAADTTTLCPITGARSPNYTPVAVDDGRILAARVTYTDAYVTDANDNDEDDGDMAHVVMQAAVETEDPANTAPKFRDDQDANTPGDQADAERSVPENANNTNVGDPVTASDSNGDLLIYSLSGADASAFKIDSGLKAGDTAGQIKTAMKLDYETKDSYMVVVTATDPSGATDTINVNISVTDEDDKTTIGLVTGPTPEEPGSTCGMSPAGSSLAADCETLISIMDELIGDGTATLNWSADTSIADDWEGVAAGTGRVAGIYLPNKGLAGTLPAEIANLDALTRLTLTDNDLTGEIPDLSALDNLTLLVLGGNAFTGEIPASLGGLDSLLRLWLHRNEGGFEGGIPAELGNLSNLRYLMLHGNGLTGSIPAELGNATNLKALYLYDNMLTGSIPAELGNLMTDADDTIRLLYLHDNMLSGDVPAELGNLTSLTRLLLRGNMLTGCVPASIADVADLDRSGLMACAN